MSEFCNIAICSRPYHCEEMTVDGSQVNLVRCDVPYETAMRWFASKRPVAVSVGCVCFEAIVIAVDRRKPLISLWLQRISEPWAVAHQRLDWPETVRRIRNA